MIIYIVNNKIHFLSLLLIEIVFLLMLISLEWGLELGSSHFKCMAFGDIGKLEALDPIARS